MAPKKNALRKNATTLTLSKRLLKAGVSVDDVLRDKSSLRKSNALVSRISDTFSANDFQAFEKSTAHYAALSTFPIALATRFWEAALASIEPFSRVLPRGGLRKGGLKRTSHLERWD